MSFKDFSDFNEEANQLSLVNDPSLGCINNKTKALQQAIAHVRDAAQRYASSYAKVAVWDYSNAGHPQDVTPVERQSVPDNILAAARAELVSASRGIKELLGNTKRGDPLRNKRFQEVFTTAGTAAVLQPWKSEILSIQLSESAISSIEAIVFSAVNNNDVMEITLDQVFASRIILNGTRTPRILVEQGAAFKAGAFTSVLSESGLLITILVEQTTGGVFACIWNPRSGKLLWGEMERKAGDTDWLYLASYTVSDFERPADDAALYSQMVKLITSDQAEVTSTSSVNISVASSVIASSISTRTQISLVDDIQSAYVASTVANTEQLDALESSLA